MATRTIKHASFSFDIEQEDPIRPGEKILVERRARRGETVDIPRSVDLQRGERFGAFGKVASPDALPIVIKQDADDDEVVEEAVRNLTDDELIAWIRDDKPTVQQVIDAAEGDPEQARRLLMAEDAATGGDSRAGVVKGLTAIIGNAQ